MNFSPTSLKFLADLAEVLKGVQITSPRSWGHDWFRGEGSFDGNNGPSIYLIGNGGSAAVASHIANDLVKKGHSAITLTDPATMTCTANDFGWERVFEQQLRIHMDEEYSRTLIAISSSGQSQNILCAAKYWISQGKELVTLTGFDPDNPLRKLGGVNYWVPSSNYGLVEIAHLAILHSVVSV